MRDADLEDLLAPAEAELAHGAPHLLGDLPGLLERAVLEEHAELVAAQPRQHVAAPHPGAQEGGDLLEHLVARQVAAGVVDHLELVEVEIEEDVVAALAAGAADGALQARPRTRGG